uniref:Methyltransferase domain-containing protein n=1 Tax=Candidatus Kentrum sp. MB TaxID=2138164 RepID=A0A451B997_9GAMM|nr:MAG: Methyltransferase domain-containing protein [Candidatus Kentron sp. MB]VFK29667.1 MAG: Methyltransferase domain-containing protein [Candidatus Kentron sp. MB]VFK74864.1 MAG: Methyltransferase domain-containing protein [Candidatus Kentron sp. MB]
MRRQAESIFDLEKRVYAGDPFDGIEKCRLYDRDIRSSMIIPMQHMLSLVEPFCKPGAKVLDVGCGSGLLSLRLAGRFPGVEVYGIDSNDHFLTVAQENLILANLVGYPGEFSFEWGRPHRLPVEDNSVDVVLSFCALHRWNDPINTLKECERVCEDSGLVIIYDLARDAEDGMISFILQYTGTGHQDFMDAMRASFTMDEMAEFVRQSGVSDWQVASEAVNLIVTSQPMDTSYSVGEASIYENVFRKGPEAVPAV